jgi:hypothetical protein
MIDLSEAFSQGTTVMAATFRIQLSEAGFPILLVRQEGLVKVEHCDIETASYEQCYQNLEDWKVEFPNIKYISVGLRADYTKENPYEVWDAVKQFCKDNNIEYINTTG